MIEAYDVLVKAEKPKVFGETFNAGYENKTVLDLANIVKNVIGEDVETVVSDSDDNRSYHISSQK